MSKSLYEMLSSSKEYLKEKYESGIMPLEEYEYHIKNIDLKKEVNKCSLT